MIQTYRRDGGNARHEHVRRVESATQAGFDHGNVDVLLRYPVECQRGRHLEKGGAQIYSGRNPLLKKFENIFLGDRDAVYRDPLAKID